MSDEINHATLLAELSVKRNRTVADLDTVRTTMRSIHRSIEALDSPEKDPFEQAFTDLTRSDLTDERRAELYEELHQIFKNTISDLRALIEELERLHVQEDILLSMLEKLDEEIENAKAEFRK